MKIDVNVNEAIILPEIEKIVEYEVRNLYEGDVSLYNTTRITQQEHPILVEFIEESIQDILTYLDDMATFIPGIERIEITVPDRFMENLAQAVESDTFSYIVKKSVARWFSISHISKEDKYIKQADKHLYEVIENLHKKNRPVIKTDWGKL